MIALLLAALAAAAPPTETVYEPLTGLGGGWHDFGWAPHTLAKGQPATVDFSGYGGWILYKPLDARFGALRLRIQAPPGFGAFLAVRLESPSRKLPEVVLTGGRAGPDGFTEFEVPFARLNPASVPFEKVVLRAVRDVPAQRVAIGGIWFVGAPAAAQEEYLSFAGPRRTVRLSVDCSAPARPISPLIYGVGFGIPRQGEEAHLKALGAAARRWGGNPSSRYNWRLGNAWNTGSDWFFQNTDYHVPPGFSWRTFLDQDRSLGLATALTVPMLGWVAKDAKTPSFPVSLFGPQHAVAPENHDAGDGRGLSGNELPPLSPQRTSVAMPPAGIEEWVRAIAQGGRGVDMYILDNEPALWSSTHRDVHPEPLTYDELLERMLTYGAAVRRADPKALIAGPAEWGWPNFFYSAADLKSHLHGDRLRHGNKPLLPWLLGKIREHEKRTGTRILDVLDVHWYPQFKGAGVQLQGETTPEVAARRIRATRSLWDPDYRDESWIDDEVQLIPRLRKWIDENAPGVGISIGEWNFGAESHLSGGLAVAEVLGRFGTLGVTSAFYWTDPPAGTPAFEAFRAYRNYDGKGARFPDWSVPAHSLDPMVSVFAARSEDRRKLVVIVLDLDPGAGAAAQLFLPGCGNVQGVRAFGYAEGSRELHEVPAPRPEGASLEEKVPPYSITVLELELPAPARP